MTATSGARGPATGEAPGAVAHGASGGGILDELSWRGLLAQATGLDALRAELTAGPITVYAGFDPTARSLHAGHLVPLLTLRRFQLAGHRPVALSGGATGLIGDPSGRSSERSLHDESVVAEWRERIRAQLGRFLDFRPGRAGALLVDNLAWTADLPVITFLRDVGKHFPVGQMLAKESVASRLAGGISFTEFSYMLLQSLDYLELFRRHDCRLQIGGSDQWGNITAGLDLIRRVTGASVHGLTLPLVTRATGEKFGKSAGGAQLWLDPALTSPYAFYQYWVNVDDRDVITYLRYFTFLDRPEIDQLAGATADQPAARAAQRRLATELTTLVHGPVECGRVVAASEALFGHGELDRLDPATLGAALAEAGTVAVGNPPPPLLDLFGQAFGISRSEGRRLIAEGGAYLNNRRVADGQAVPAPGDLVHGRWLVLRRGRRQVAGVQVGV